MAQFAFSKALKFLEVSSTTQIIAGLPVAANGKEVSATPQLFSFGEGV